MISTAKICDALASRPEYLKDVRIYPNEFPILSANDLLEGDLAVVYADGRQGSKSYWIKYYASISTNVVLIENFGRVDCACFENSDLPQKSNPPKGIIINGALRDASILAGKKISIRSKAVHPMPFAAQPESAEDLKGEPCAFGGRGYVVGDGDGLIVLRHIDLFKNLGLL
jgi:regulator of RNase E activity RraA